MRVLIVSAILACAAAAPSGVFGPVFYQSVAIPAVIPTVSSGDLQAAAIDAQVKINDLARAAADHAQLIADQQRNLAEQQQNLAELQQNSAELQQNSAELQKNSADANASPVVKATPEADSVNENNEEAYWSDVDKKWQALDALNTAQAKLDAAIASNAGAIASVGGVVPYAASPFVYSPYLAALKSLSTEVKTEEKKEEKKEEKQEAVVKTAEPEKEAVVESAEKTEGEKPAVNTLGYSVVTPYSSVYRYNVPVAPLANVFGQPILKYAPIQSVNTIYTPYLRTVW